MNNDRKNTINCPRCNGISSFSKEVLQSVELDEKSFNIYCTECYLTGKSFDSKKEAVKWWNTRYKVDDEDVVTELLDKMIMETPSGDYRNQLCDINILWLRFMYSLKV